MPTLMPLLALLAAVTAATPAVAGPFEQHGAHVHDRATLDVALDGNRLSVSLLAPAVNVLGFERAPRTPAERQAVTDATVLLAQPARLFLMNAAARCRVVAREVSAPDFASGDHADFRARWEMECAVPTALTFLDVRLAGQLKGEVTIEATVLADTGTRTARLTRSASRLVLR